MSLSTWNMAKRNKLYSIYHVSYARKWQRFIYYLDFRFRFKNSLFVLIMVTDIAIKAIFYYFTKLGEQLSEYNEPTTLK